MRTSTIAPLVALAAGLVAGVSPADAGVPTCAGEVATIVGTPGDDVLTGTPGADVIDDVVVRSADQELVGGPGDDSLAFSWRIEEDGEEVPVRVLTDFAEGVAVLGETGVAFPARSFRTVRARFSAGTWAVVGTDRDDRYTTHQYMSLEADTGRGRDVVHGSWHDDIHGGPGLDTAYASRGRDTCRSVERGSLGECETLH